MKFNLLCAALLALGLLFGACDGPLYVCDFGIENWDETVIPKSITVKSVKILKYPGKRPDGTDWDENETDLNRLPDLVIRMGPSIPGAEKLAGSNSLYNADPTVNPTVSLDFLNPLDPERYKFRDELTGFYFIGLYDSDCGNPCTYDEMGAILFRFYEPGRAFPNSMILQAPGLPVAFELEIVNEY